MVQHPLHPRYHMKWEKVYGKGKIRQVRLNGCPPERQKVKTKWGLIEIKRGDPPQRKL